MARQCQRTDHRVNKLRVAMGTGKWKVLRVRKVLEEAWKNRSSRKWEKNLPVGGTKAKQEVSLVLLGTMNGPYDESGGQRVTTRPYEAHAAPLRSDSKACARNHCDPGHVPHRGHGNII